MPKRVREVCPRKQCSLSTKVDCKINYHFQPKPHKLCYIPICIVQIINDVSLSYSSFFFKLWDFRTSFQNRKRRWQKLKCAFLYAPNGDEKQSFHSYVASIPESNRFWNWPYVRIEQVQKPRKIPLYHFTEEKRFFSSSFSSTSFPHPVPLSSPHPPSSLSLSLSLSQVSQ